MAGLVEAVLESACRAAGLDRSSVESARPIGGGCINHALKVRTAGHDFCLKWNAGAGRDFFRMEAEGLSALAGSDAVDVPRVIALGGDDDEVPWLLLEWIDEARATGDTWRQLGHGLARLHRTRQGPSPGADPLTPDAAMPVRHAPGFGWHRDNVIGSLPQPNRWMDDWAEFWTEQRILPLARELGSDGTLSRRGLTLVERAAARMSGLLAPAATADGPSLLHGDLWSGNVLFGRRQTAPDTDPLPFVIDPAVYIGHREVDLAMCRLFGGFAAPFYDAYEAAWPLQPDHERRMAAYQLYPLLVHARLFAGGYVASVARSAQAVLDASRQAGRFRS
ncbi:MAG: fructosamine kinase family protein [Gemmatimonadota bacterium]|nr:fructosamine kinase family protein [Gemmatimonadota bacterium]